MFCIFFTGSNIYFIINHTKNLRVINQDNEVELIEIDLPTDLSKIKTYSNKQKLDEIIDELNKIWYCLKVWPSMRGGRRDQRILNKI